MYELRVGLNQRNTPHNVIGPELRENSRGSEVRSTFTHLSKHLMDQNNFGRNLECKKL